jgi:pimeloyl-ACP methyl ester carboxylesterase
MAAALRDGRHASIPGAGHNVILEAPDDVRRLVTDFVGSV